MLGAGARARVELEVLRALQPVNAYLGQEIALGTTREGKVSVGGIVADVNRRRALAAALGAIAAETRGHVSMDVATTEEAATRQRAASRRGSDASTPPIRSYTVVANGFPAFDRVRAALERDAPAAADAAADAASTLEERAQRFASRVLALSRTASQHSAALHNIASRVTQDLAAGMSATDRATFDAVIGWHAERLERALIELSGELARVYGPANAHAAPPPDAERMPPEPMPETTIWALIDRLVELNTIRGYAITRAFSAGVAEDPDIGIVDTADFRTLVAESIQAARQLRSP